MKKLFLFFKSRGVNIIIKEPPTDYITEFFKIKRKGKYIGDFIGFPIPLKSNCWVNSRLKVKANKEAEKEFNNNTVYIGLRYDEQERAKRILINNKKSILYEHKYTKNDVFNICKKYDLLSPIYNSLTRDGCFFCPQMNIASSQYIMKNYPELVNELIQLQKYDKHYFALNYQTVEDFYNRKYKRKENII